MTSCHYQARRTRETTPGGRPGILTGGVLRSLCLALPFILAVLCPRPALCRQSPGIDEEPASLARPQALLAPSGLLFPGPMPPTGTQMAGGHVVVVNPSTGKLWLSIHDIVLPGEPMDMVLARLWTSSGWRWLDLAWLKEDQLGITVTRPGSTTLRFDAQEPLPSGQRWPAGAMFQLSSGELLQCTESGYRLHLPGGDWREFDHGGRQVFMGKPGGAELRMQWSDQNLRAMSSEDGRLIELMDVRASGHGSLNRLARASGGLQVTYEMEDGLIAAVKNIRGVRESYVYDDENRLRAILWPDGSRLTVERDESGRVVLIEGPGQTRWSYKWGPDGLLTTSDGLGRSWRIQREGDSTTVTDSTGRWVTLFREGDKTTGWTDPAGGTTKLEWNSAGHLSSITQSNGATYVLDSDAQGLIRQITDPSGSAWKYQRDSMNRLDALVYPDASVSRLRLDGKGRIREVQRGSYRYLLSRNRRGLITEITFPSNNSIVLQRDEAGRIVSITDASGMSTRLSAYRGFTPGIIQSADGRIWKISFDLMGRPDGVASTAEEPRTWHRGPRGTLDWFRKGAAKTLLHQRSDGMITMVEDPLERRTGWELDPASRLKSWCLPDGSRIILKRDARGEVSGILYGDQTIQLKRDFSGRLVSVETTGTNGTVERMSILRDSVGRITSLAFPTGLLKLERSSSGASQAITLDDRRWEIRRDEMAFLEEVREGSSKWKVARDADGLVMSLEGPENRWELKRDLRGLPVRMSTGLGEDLSWQYGAAGRPLKAQGTDGSSLGIDYDTAGRPRLLRFSDGSIIWLQQRENPEERRFDGPSGQTLDLASVERDALDRPVLAIQNGRELRYRYDPLGALAVLEEAQQVWSAIPGLITGPRGATVETDPTGRPKRAIASPGPAPWGLDGQDLIYQLDQRGTITAIEGSTELVTLAHDALGRLTALTYLSSPRNDPLPYIQSSYHLEYDPFGNLRYVQGPEGQSIFVTAFRAIRAMLGPGGTWLFHHAPDGSCLLSGPMGSWTAMADIHGNPALLRDPSGETIRVDFTPLGFPDRDNGLPLGAGAALQLFAGGPLIGPMGSLDPVTGRTTALLPFRWPWDNSAGIHGNWDASWLPIDGSVLVDWDPAYWAPEGPWAEPLKLVVEMSLVPAPIQGEWMALTPAPAPLPWLPASLEANAPPLGPGPRDLPLDLNPLESLLIRTASRPPGILSTDDIVKALLQHDLDTMPRPLPGVQWPANLPEPELSPRRQTD